MSRISISFECGESAGAVAEALAPETELETSRLAARVAVDRGTVRVEMEAADLTTLRAAANSYLRWLKIASETAQLAGR